MEKFDHIVIGSGIAGLTYALKAAQSGTVAVVTKRAKAVSNTAWAQGGVACVTSPEDSFELHIKDTLEAGAGLCHEDIVELVVHEGPERIRELIELGMSFEIGTCSRSRRNWYPHQPLRRSTSTTCSKA